VKSEGWGTRKSDAGKMPFETPFGKLRAGRTSPSRLSGQAGATLMAQATVGGMNPPLQTKGGAPEKAKNSRSLAQECGARDGSLCESFASVDSARAGVQESTQRSGSVHQKKLDTGEDNK
jgi:hypothetical protein